MNWQKPALTTITTFDDSDAMPVYSVGAWQVDETMPLKRCIAMANSLNHCGWFCIPHRLTNEAIAEFCQVAERDCVHPYVIEYSNETWAQGDEKWSPELHQHHQWLKDQSAGDWMATVADRVRVIAQHIGTRGRLVLCGQAQWDGVLDKLLNDYALGGVVDAIGIASYAGANHRILTNGVTAENLTPAQLTELITLDIAGAITDGITAHSKLALHHNIDLYQYEFGTHYIGDADWLDDWYKKHRAIFDAMLIELFTAHDIKIACQYSGWSRWTNQRFGRVDLGG